MAKESNYVLSGGVSIDVEPKDNVSDEYDFNDGFEKNNSKSIDNIMYFLTSISNALNEHFTDSPMLIQNSSYENDINNQNQLKDNIKKEIEQNAQEREQKLKRISNSKKQQRENAKLNNAIKNAINNKNSNSISKINVPTGGLGFSYNQINSGINEPLIKKQQRNQVKKYNENLEKLQNRADILYGTDEEYFKKYTQNNSHNYNCPVKKEITKQILPDISNPDKLLFPGGKTLADMPMKSLENVDTNKLNNIPPIILKELLKQIKYSPVKDYVVKKYGKETAENLHMSLKETYLNTEYAKQFHIYHNYIELNGDIKSFVKSKLELIGVNDITTIKGIYIHPCSSTSIDLSHNKELISAIKQYKKNINQGINTKSGVSFTKGNFYYAIGLAYILNMRINNKGELDVLLFDTYDFNKKDDRPLVIAGKILQDLGIIKPFFVFYHVIIPKSETDKIIENM